MKEDPMRPWISVASAIVVALSVTGCKPRSGGNEES